MNQNQKTTPQSAKQPKGIPTVSAVLPDNALLEMIYDPVRKQSAFVVWQDNKWSVEPGFSITPEEKLVPYGVPQNQDQKSA